MKTYLFPVLAVCLNLLAVLPAFADTASNDACRDLAVGESRVVDRSVVPIEFARTYQVRPNFILKREASETAAPAYTAMVNIKFKPVDDQTNDAAMKQMLDYVSSCYTTLPTMHNKDGSTLRVRLALPSENAPENTVNLTSVKMRREDSMHWSTQTQCRAIIHETFHLLGLADLYNEMDPFQNQTNHYDCRKIGPQDSVMHWIERAHFPATYDNDSGQVSEEDSLEPLLYPGEFRMITHPGCYEQNKMYYECAQNAYRTAYLEGCIPVSPVCDLHSKWVK